MRIVLLNQYYLPSEAPTGLLLADLGEALVAAGHEVTAICSDRDYADPESRYPRTETRGGVRVRRVSGSGFGRGRRLGRLVDYLTFMAGALLMLAIQRKPDVIVVLTTPPMLAFPSWWIARVRSARFVFWVMDVYPDLAFELGVLRRGSPGGAVLQHLSRRVLKGADRVVALGDVMAAHRVIAKRPHTVLTAESTSAAVVVLGATTRGLWHRVFAGPSITRQLLRHATCPVVVVPDGWTPPPRPPTAAGATPNHTNKSSTVSSRR